MYTLPWPRNSFLIFIFMVSFHSTQNQIYTHLINLQSYQAQWLSGLSSQSCPEESIMTWEQIAVQLVDQDSCVRMLEGPENSTMASPLNPTLVELPNSRS
jgi:hypothetical protein